MNLILVFCFAASVLGITCPAYDCGSLNTGVCATFDTDNTTVLVNDGGCSSNSTCSIGSVVSFAATNVTQAEAQASAQNTTYTTPLLNCKQGGSSISNVHGSQNVTCAMQSSAKNFTSGDNPKSCTTASDCALKDNSTTECLCGFDGKSYCKPPLTSGLFDFLSENCLANNGTINDTSVETYASLLLDYYPYLLNIPNCINNILEVEAIESLAATVPGVDSSPVTDDSSAEELMMTVALLTALIA